MARTETVFDAGELGRLAARRDKLDRERQDVGVRIAEQLRAGRQVGMSVTTLAPIARLTRPHASRIINRGGSNGTA